MRELEARGALDPRPGRTAGEVARDGGAAVPAVADDLRRAARVFDEVWYGGRPADAASYAALVAVDARVASSRLAVRVTAVDGGGRHGDRPDRPLAPRAGRAARCWSGWRWCWPAESLGVRRRDG